MAKRIEPMNELRSNPYPWKQWTDGNAWLIEEGVDFTNTSTSMRAYLYSYATKHGLKVTTKAVQGGIAFQFRKTDQPARDDLPKGKVIKRKVVRRRSK